MLYILQGLSSLAIAALWILLPLSSLFWILSPRQKVIQFKATKFIQALLPILSLIAIFSSFFIVLIFSEVENPHWSVWSVLPFYSVGVTGLLMVALNLSPSSMLTSVRNLPFGTDNILIDDQKAKSGDKTIRLARIFSLSAGVCIFISFWQYMAGPIISLFFK